MADFDVIVAGAGPAGSTCALFLARQGLKVLLLDKASFPRDKICADNKTWLCTSIVKELGLWPDFEKLPKQAISRMLFSTPGGEELNVEMEEDKIKREGTQYNVRRIVFDDFLFQAAKRSNNVTVIEGFSVSQAVSLGDKVIGVKGIDAQGKEIQYLASVVVGADGSTSAFAKSVGLNPVVKERHATNMRAYFTGVECDREKVELHYLKGVCPGYFWIFPVDGGLCNVGVGVATKDVEKKSLDLEKMLSEIISSPKFSARFSKAKQESPWKTWTVTVCGHRKKICGNGFVLIGDAANTALSFSGEGVGPAMRSGKMAAEAIAKAFEEKNFSGARLKALYEDQLWEVLDKEVNGFWFLEFLIKNPFAFNWAIKKANKSEKLKKLASGIMSDYTKAKELWKAETFIELLR